jgi:4-hydroxybenzoate polyprenyltransferase/phosphoserine phosphatase
MTIRDNAADVASREPTHGRCRATSGMPLCVDLDGTLPPGDTLLDSALQLLRRNPAYVFVLPLWWSRSRAYMKQEVARRVDIDPAHWPFRPGVLAYLRREHRRGRRIALATASDRRIADAVAAHLGLFGDVLASDGTINLKGRTKASALSRRFGDRGYVYAGDSRADIPVWQAAAAGVVVGNSERLAARVAHVAPIECRLAAEARPTLRMLLRLARPHQWVKSLLLLVPLMTAHRLGDAAAALAEVRAIVAVCLASSAIYVVNDLVDMAADRAHPTKRNRPIACGAISPLLAVPFAACLAAAAVLVARPLPHAFMLLLDVYFAGTIAYSVWLKAVPAVDVLALTSLYGLRVYLGAAAIGVTVSGWLLAFVGFLFLGLALLKRYVEIGGAIRDGRDVGRWRGYLPRHLRRIQRFGIASGLVAAGIVAAYTTSGEAAAYYRTPLVLYGLAPLLALWLVRAWRIAGRGNMHDDPILFALRDAASYAVVVAMLVVTQIAI